MSLFQFLVPVVGPYPWRFLSSSPKFKTKATPLVAHFQLVRPFSSGAFELKFCVESTPANICVKLQLRRVQGFSETYGLQNRSP
ncbi:hypothetical protein CASFOL_033541 [Castilleja foliolosa]|uniref:Uncharacterized protein n=1 Tax=Castilleja foliolosa TaxID=1961234 RepID=A0ABD3BX70_9LAMI